MKVLGISAFFHDSAASVVVDGQVIAAAQEERFSRIKNDSSLPLQAIRFCLKQAQLEIEDIDYVIFYEKPIRKFERIVVNQLREFPHGLSQFSRAMTTWLSKRLWLKGDICKAIGCRPDQLLFSEHHLSHAASAFLGSPYDSATIVTVDGVGEWATTSIFRGVTDEAGTRIELLHELHFPHSIGLLYSALTAFLGFKVNEGEYKVMGLAAYGQPKYLKELEQIFRIDADGSCTADMSYFAYQRSATQSFTPKLEELLGAARSPGSKLRLPAVSDDEQRYADIAASLQKLTERYLLTVVKHAHELTGDRNLAMAGGVALNVVANRKILEEGPFDEVFVCPAAGDAGGAIGAALWATHVVGGIPRKAAMGSAFLGEQYDQDSVQTFLKDCRVKHRSFENNKDLANTVARNLAQGAVGGWFKGRFEWGPRALGARSILADPRRANMKQRVNAKIKFREGFRPFAPAVLEEDMPQWFEFPKDKVQHLTPFMCCVAPATDEAQREIPAVVHVDGTARVQSVQQQHNPDFHELLESFKAETGVGVLLNTSMNLKDEPICASPAEAYATFMRSGLDFLVIENCLIEKGAQ